MRIELKVTSSEFDIFTDRDQIMDEFKSLISGLAGMHPKIKLHFKENQENASEGSRKEDN